MNQQQEYEEQLTLFQILKILWKRKWQIITGITAVTILTAIITMILPRTYLSHAILTVSDLEKIRIEENKASPSTGLAIPVFQNYMSTFQSRQLFITYLKKYNYLGEWKKKDFKIRKLIEPNFAYSEKNQRLRGKSNFVVSLKVKGEAGTPEAAKNKALILGKYIRTSLINLWVFDQVFSWKAIVVQKIIRNELNLEKLQDYITQLKDKETFLIDMISKTPGNATGQDPVNISKSTEKYLPLRQQLTAIRIEIKDTELSISRVQKKLKTNKLILEFHKSLAVSFDATKLFLANETLFDDLVDAQKAFFKDKKGPEVSAAFFKVNIKFSHYANYRDSLYEFMSNPTQPINPVRPKRRLIVVFSCVAAFFFFIFLALAIEWWKRNEDR